MDWLEINNVGNPLTWKELGNNLVQTERARCNLKKISGGVAIMSAWCSTNLPELDRILAMEKTIEAQQAEIDSLVARLKGE